ncbi:hypothetical protein Nepgr_013589 [Nepenthes gracilis]|uniref:Uncharacterized protein n=1 Tax=Nepenthes gracilis TaxID=150966 RepID=A0AAD3SI50_NEPGR|nr:hypothetical protein Nepgr_013589 [Nepenthes gracilis]
MSAHREDKQRVSFQSQPDSAPSVQVLNQFDVLQSNVEAEMSKVCEKDVLFQAQFVGEQQKIPTVTDDHHGGDPSSCTNLGKLRRNIIEIRKQLNASRAQAIEDSSNPGSTQFYSGGSAFEQTHPELPKALIIGERIT